MTSTFVLFLQRFAAGGSLFCTLLPIPARASNLFHDEPLHNETSISEPEFAYNDIAISTGYDLDIRFSSVIRTERSSKTPGIRLPANLIIAAATTPSEPAVLLPTGCGLIALSTLSRRFRKPS